MDFVFWGYLAGITLLVLVYYLSIRGAFFLTRQYAGRWERRLFLSFVLALFFAPSFVVVGTHGGGLLPVPAWVAFKESIHYDDPVKNRLSAVGMIVGTWVFFFVVSLAFGSRGPSAPNKGNLGAHEENKEQP